MSLGSTPSCLQQVELANRLLKQERRQELPSTTSMEKICDGVLRSLGAELCQGPSCGLKAGRLLMAIRDPLLLRTVCSWLLQHPTELDAAFFADAIKQLKRLHLCRADRVLAGRLIGRLKILGHLREGSERLHAEINKVRQTLANYKRAPQAELARLKRAGVPVDQLDNGGYLQDDKLDDSSMVAWARAFEMATLFTNRGYRVLASGQSSFHDLLGDYYQQRYLLKCPNRFNSLHRPQRQLTPGVKVPGLSIGQIWAKMQAEDDHAVSSEVICCSSWLADNQCLESYIYFCDANENVTTFRQFVAARCMHGKSCRGACTQLLHPLNQIAVTIAVGHLKAQRTEGAPGIINLFALRPKDLERLSKQTHEMGRTCNNVGAAPKAGEELFVELQHGEQLHHPKRARQCPEHHTYVQARLAAFHLPRRVRIVRISHTHPLDPPSRATLEMRLIATIEHTYDRLHVGLSASKQSDLALQLLQLSQQIPTMSHSSLKPLADTLNDTRQASEMLPILRSNPSPMELDDSKSSSTDRGDSKSSSR
jgi:hypothetical protein